MAGRKENGAYFLDISPTFLQLPGKFIKDTQIHLKMSFIYAGMNILEMHRFYFNLKYSTFKLEASCLKKAIFKLLMFKYLRILSIPHLWYRLILPKFLIPFLPNCKEN